MIEFLVKTELNKFIIKSYYKFERNDIDSDTESDSDIEDIAEENNNENDSEDETSLELLSSWALQETVKSGLNVNNFEAIFIELKQKLEEKYLEGVKGEDGKGSLDKFYKKSDIMPIMRAIFDSIKEPEIKHLKSLKKEEINLDLFETQVSFESFFLERSFDIDTREHFYIEPDGAENIKEINLSDLFYIEPKEENLNDIEIDFIVYRQIVPEFITFLKLKSTFQYNSIIDIVVIDNLNYNFRFTVIYYLQSLVNNSVIRVITKTNNILPIISVCQLFPAYNWVEREIWDMFGIFFIKHADLRRILTDYGFIGHPLKKDFPMTGYKELIYHEELKHPTYINVELMQNLRIIQMNNNWLINEKAF